MIQIVTQRGEEAIAREIAQILQFVWKLEQAPEVVSPGTASARATAWDDVLIVVYRSGALTPDVVGIIESFRKAHGVGGAQPGQLQLGGVMLPLALTELGLIDEYEFVVQPRLAGHGPTLFAGLSKHVDLKLVSRLELGSGAVAMRYEPRR